MERIETLYKMNKFQTRLTEEVKNSLPREVYLELIDILSSITFIKNLIATEDIRGYAKDVKKSTDYNDGRIEVDLANPHILEDMDFFREKALFFEKHGKYTNLTPNPNPKSEYGTFWKQELHRWKYGLVRPSDGEWIPGELYFYWNYSPIWLVEQAGTQSDGAKSQGERVRKFAKPWLGDYLFHHYVEQCKRRGKHGKMLKCRGVGASFKAASWSPRNIYVHPGSGNPNFHLASDKGFLSGDKGIWGKIVDCLDWIAETTPLERMRVVDRAGSTLEIQLGFKDEYGVRKGNLASVHGISLKDNPDKARGIRGPLIHYEEDGLFNNLEKAWNVNRKAVEDGNTTFGFMIAMGTGGVEGGSFEGSEKLFYSPGAYNVYGIPNVFDKNANGDTLCGFFWGAYMNRKNCYDEQIGEPDVIKALIEILLDRHLVKYSSTDPSAITQKKAEECITPQDAIMRTEGTVFPVSDLKDYLESIMVRKESFLAEHYVGELVRTNDGKLKWRLNNDKFPLRSYDKDNANREGCLEIFEMPAENANGEIAHGRYIFGCLPPGEKVMTSEGYKNIEDIDHEDLLISKDGEEVKIIKKLEYDANNDKLYEIKVHNTLSTTKFTSEHPILISDEKFGYTSSIKAKKLNLPYKFRKFNFDFVKADLIKEGQWTKVPNTFKKIKEIDLNLWDNSITRVDKQIINPLNNKDFWWLIGLMLGDGWIESNGYSVSFAINSDEVYYIEKLCKIIETLFKRKPTLRERNGCTEIRFCNKQLNNFLNIHFGKYANGKKIPEFVKYMKPEFKIQLISGYLAADGCILNNDKYCGNEFVSINKYLLEDFQDILFSLGIISSVTILRKEGLHKFKDKFCKTKETYRLRISHNDSIKLKTLINDSKCHKLNRFNYTEIVNEKKVNCYFDENKEYIYFRIEKINVENYTGKVYNFECETNTFMCKHITTHNCDPIDADSGTSLFSVIGMDTFTDRIVCEFTGRPRLAEEAYEITLRLLEFYNGIANYEKNLKGLFSYFDKKNALFRLCDTPQILKDMQMTKDMGYGNTSKGTMANAEVNKWGRKLQADWMNTSLEDDENPGKLKLHTLRGLAYIEECIKWNSDGNFDRVSAGGMLFILREDRYKRTQSAIANKDKQVETLANDKFFNRNFNKPNAMNGKQIHY